MAFSEYQAAHGHGTGWSWTVAKGKGKLPDLIAAQGADWDDAMTIARLAASDEKPNRAFDPHFRARRPKPEMCTAQVREVLARKFEVKGQNRPRIDSGEAGRVLSILLGVMTHVTGKGTGRPPAAIRWQEWVEQGRSLARGAGGRMVSVEENAAGEVETAVYVFADGSKLTINSDGAY